MEFAASVIDFRLNLESITLRWT